MISIGFGYPEFIVLTISLCQIRAIAYRYWRTEKLNNSSNENSLLFAEFSIYEKYGKFEMNEKLNFRPPNLNDGFKIHRLISECPPLDSNSAYCNFLQCSHFSSTSVIAEAESDILGWVSGFRSPNADYQFFVWQVAVAPEARGQGLGLRMLDALIMRPALSGITGVATSISPGNAASWALFQAFARRHNAALNHRPWLERDIHFEGQNDSEHLVMITPLVGHF